MLNNLFGKVFKYLFLGIFVFEVLSYFAHQNQILNTLIFYFLAATVFALSFYKIEYAFYIVLIELFVGSKGHLFFIELWDNRISIRIGLFAAIFLAWAAMALFNKHRQFFKSHWLSYYLVIFVFLILGLTNGILNNSFKSIYLDINGWLYFLLVPIFFAALKNQQIIKNSLSLLLSAVSYLSIKTLAVLLIFVYQPSIINMTTFYKWLRDSGVAEITYVSDTFYRIFFQAHFYVMIGFIICLGLLLIEKFNPKDRRWLWLISFLSSTTILASLSRSFWAALAPTLFCFFIYLFINKVFNLKTVFKIILTMLVIGFLEVGFLYFITGSFGQGVIKNRFQAGMDEAAASTRLQQLPPLWHKISNSPFIGSGFGSEVSFVSNDPRIRAQIVDGIYTTYAFEWGYLDIWLEMGILALLAYLLFIGKIGVVGLKGTNLSQILAFGLLAAALTHAVSPYLNHPLGIGFIMLYTAIISFNQKEELKWNQK